MSVVERTLSRITNVDPKSPSGVVRGVIGLLIESKGPPLPVGSVVEIIGRNGGASGAEVVGFNGGRVLLMPYEGTRSIRLGDVVRAKADPIPIADSSWLGRVLDGLARPLDGGPPLVQRHGVREPYRTTNPLRRRPQTEALTTGVRAIDATLTCARGQRIGIFGGSGVGKSTLLAQMARGSDADVAVIALVGERGREVKEFVEHELGAEGLARSVVISSTSDVEALLRLRAAETALEVAEAFRDEGKSVLLILDSLTRVAMAQREIGLAAGEPPTARGYPPSMFAMLPRVVERAGNFERGSITAFFTVLVEGDDMNEPVADTARGLLDGHIVLSRELGERGHFPAIDLGASLSRLMNRVATDAQRQQVQHLRRLLAAHRRAEDLIAVGAYIAGQDPLLDEAVRKMSAIEAFLVQPFEQSLPREKSLEQLAAALADPVVGAEVA